MATLTKHELAELAELLQTTVERLQTWRGRKVRITESLSHARGLGGHDRHFSTWSSFEMAIVSVSGLFDGMRLQLHGESSSFNYEIALFYVVSIEIEGDTISFTEQFETKIERLTVISLVS